MINLFLKISQTNEFSKYNVLNIWPPTTRIVIRKRWREFFKLRGDQEVVLIPYINARGKVKEEKGIDDVKICTSCLFLKAK
jgi:hypothetical protein